MLHLLAQQDPTSAALFWLFALVSAGSAIGVVASRNIVRMAVCLLFTLGGVAGLYFALAAEFLAAIQLIVYAGGTLILIVFGIMLTSKSPFSRLAAKPGEIATALAIGSVLLVALVVGIHSAASTGDAPNGAFGGQGLEEGQRYPMTRLGQVLLGDYLIPFEIVSVLLLVVMIGAAYLAKARRREP